jgi:hypothetical protein
VPAAGLGGDHVRVGGGGPRHGVRLPPRCPAYHLLQREGNQGLNSFDPRRYFEADLNSWDIAAGALLVAEAGGRVSHIDGR